MKRMLQVFALCCAGVCAAALLPPEVALVYPIAPANGSITIDGNIDDPGWKGAIEVSSFTDSGSPDIVKDQTAMKMCYDKDNFYIAVTCFESNMPKLVTKSTGHDVQFWMEDSIEIFIDEKHDHSRFYQFAVTANNGTFDLKDGDAMWSASWKSAVKRYDDRWVVEIAFPFTIFEHFEDKTFFKPVSGAMWGFNVCRDRQAGGHLELYNWADVERVFANVNLYGHLLFLDSGWEGRPEEIAAAAKAGGRTETQLQIADGFWQFTPDATAPRRMTYVESLKERFAKYPARVEELLEMTKDENNEMTRELAASLAVFDKWKARTANDEKVTSEEFGQANVFYQAFLKKLDNYYWAAKLSTLNKNLD